MSLSFVPSQTLEWKIARRREIISDVRRGFNCRDKPATNLQARGNFGFIILSGIGMKTKYGSSGVRN
jgi:hypothetical protein